MTKLNIKIKDNQKAEIVLQLLRELPFVEIEGDIFKNKKKCHPSSKGNMDDLFGIWENRQVSLHDLRESAWGKK